MTRPTDVPVRTVALGEPTVGEPELAAVAEVFASGWLAGTGPSCLALGPSWPPPWAPRTRWRSATAPRPCTWRSRRSAPGPATRWSSPTTPSRPPATRCCWTGATPVFADVRPDIWTVDPAAVEAADHRRARSASSRSTRSASPPTTTSCARSPTGTACGWWRTRPAPPARCTRAARPAASADARLLLLPRPQGHHRGEGGALTDRRRRAWTRTPASCTPSASRAR